MGMDDRIFIGGLKLETIVGVHSWEQKKPREITVDLELACDAKRAALADRLSDTIDYHAVSKRLTEFAATAKFKLIETLAERMADLLIDEFAVPWLQLTLHKPGAVEAADTIAVRIERGRNS